VRKDRKRIAKTQVKKQKPNWKGTFYLFISSSKFSPLVLLLEIEFFLTRLREFCGKN